jgi:hypothetical protein
MSGWTRSVEITTAAAILGLVGLGFGLTVTPRSTAAVESAGREAFGMASAIVTVSRMVGMAIGVAVLTAYASTTIDHLFDGLFSAANPDGWKAVIPAELRDRGLHDGLVVNALEAWASGEAARILAGTFVAAAAVTILAIPPGLALGRRARMLAGESVADGATSPGGTDRADGRDRHDGRKPTIAL